jgi:hypothetical protein
MARSIGEVVATALFEEVGGRRNVTKALYYSTHPTILVSASEFVQIHRALLGTTKPKTISSHFINAKMKFMQ